MQFKLYNLKCNAKLIGKVAQPAPSNANGILKMQQLLCHNNIYVSFEDHWKCNWLTTKLNYVDKVLHLACSW